MVIYMRDKIATQNRFNNSKKLVNQSPSLLFNLCKVVTVTLFTGCISSVFASDFYTIIGPDGRPMVVQRELPQAQKKAEKKVTKLDLAVVKPITEREPQSVIQKVEENRVSTPSTNLQRQEVKPQLNVALTPQVALENKLENKLDKKAVDTQISITPHADKTSVIQHKVLQQPSIQTSALQQSTTPIQKGVENASIAVNPTEPKENKNKAEDSKAFSSTQRKSAIAQSRSLESPFSVLDGFIQPKNDIDTVRKVEQQPSKVKPQPTKAQQNSAITVLDGVQYVDHEYLEDKEFNLEGRKRFYVMPEEGGGRVFGTVEREKGVTKSMFERFMNKGDVPEKNQTITLASDYFRLDKNQVESSLEQRCFTGKKVEKAKILGAKKVDIGIWPTEPLEDKFSYEIVKLDKKVEHLQLTSYASSQSDPTYYWPFVVFLDEQGCVLEGVSGFKNESLNQTNFQHSALVGILKIPNKTGYLFMTPLAESIDVQNIKLSNQGQLKLSVLK